MVGVGALCYINSRLDNDFNSAVNPSSDPTMQINQMITEEGAPTLEK